MAKHSLVELTEGYDWKDLGAIFGALSVDEDDIQFPPEIAEQSKQEFWKGFYGED